MGTAKTVKRPPQHPAQPQYANYWAPLTRKRHIPPHPAQPQHTNHWAQRTRKRHQQEHRPQRPTERSDPTQHVKVRTGDRPGPRQETTTRNNTECHTGGQGVQGFAGRVLCNAVGRPPRRFRTCCWTGHRRGPGLHRGRAAHCVCPRGGGVGAPRAACPAHTCPVGWVGESSLTPEHPNEGMARNVSV